MRRSLESLVLSLEDSQELLKHGWNTSTALAWTDEGLEESRDASRIIAPAPTESELVAALPAEYLGLNLSISKYISQKAGGKQRFNVGYWNPEVMNYEFVSSAR